MGVPALERRIASVRRFNRFYTQKIGVLDEGLLDSPFSLTEVRVLYELSARATATASELAADLGLDEGYLSRLLKAFRRDGLIGRQKSEEDGRRGVLSLTKKGRETFAPLDSRSREAVGALLASLPEGGQRRLVSAMETIGGLLGAEAPPAADVVLRPPRPGDLGWVVHRHGALYAEEYGWGEDFEALVAKVVANFVRHFDPKAERCWIAEKDGAVVGSVFLVRQSRTVAKLRLLYVEPSARGHGAGGRLVSACVRFARDAGYHRITLWTQSNLSAARRIYERAGFSLMRSEPNRISGQDLVAETWELDLRRPKDRPAVP
jgi:DNA-binding MarR family transcriptional regulator/GNAT superfamily N-acetyltransferase